ncbi:NAD(P)/FAD-dependent oxidoreductase [Catenulispora sp. MAP12-49]|uniref:FAD/NAD(P)-dependent oxidoreductase n=1 Tax=Catenulispora sp. MAP12-49 TaxID=3156302 RepID=UPI003515941F
MSDPTSPPGDTFAEFTDPAAFDSAAFESAAFDLAVIGAGPAGMAAAATAAEQGLHVALIDAGRQLGGQYFRHPAPGLTADWLPKLYHGWQQFEQLVTRVETAGGIEVRFGHQVWAIEQVRPTDQPQATERAANATAANTTAFNTTAFRVLTDRGPIEAPYVILATGAYERVVPFPGWDLPGVFTAGGAQALLKGNLVLPGRRVVVAGTGPLLLPVATGLAAAGAKVLGLYEANTIRGYAKNPLPLLANPTKLAEGLDYARQLTRARIPVHTGRMIIEAHGTTTLEAVTTARPDATDPHRIPCDTLAIGYGLAPQIDLALTLGAAPKHLSDGTIALRVNTTQRTSVPGLYAAGETAGVAGAETALLEGEIAGLAVAQAAARARRAPFRAAGTANAEPRNSTPAEDKPPSGTPAAEPPNPASTVENKAAAPLAARALASARARLTRQPSPSPDTSAARSSEAAAGTAPASPAAAAPKPTTRAATAATRLAAARARLTRQPSPSPDASSVAPAARTSEAASRAEPPKRLAAARARLTRRAEPVPTVPASAVPSAEATATATTPTAPNISTAPTAAITPANLGDLLRRRTRQRALADLLRARHPIPAAWRQHLADDTVVCRCEEVPAKTIAEATGELGAGDVRTVKLLTRAGMGWCQGRVCGYAVACLAAGGDPASEADLLAAASRPLARPVPLGVLAEQDRRNK